jgi:hypothetical protein
MKDYRATDGLKFLRFLGLEIKPSEEFVFTSIWQTAYLERKSIIGTVWQLYSEILPSTFKKDEDLKREEMLRDIAFSHRLEAMRLNTPNADKILEDLLGKKDELDETKLHR